MPRRIEADPYTLKVGQRVRALRLERNLSLTELAEAAEVSRGHLSGIERGLTAITIQTISRVAKGLGLPALYVLLSPADDECAQVMELVRGLPHNELVKLRRALTKTVKEAAKVAKAGRAKK